MDVFAAPSALCGTVAAPPSKSAAHRAIIAAALANGQSRISNIDLSDDIRATIGACESLGCRIDIQPDGRGHALTVNGGLSIPGSADVDCAESGSTLRFFIPIACTMPGRKTFTGRGRLPQRPIDAYFDIFRAQGLKFSHPENSSLPLSVEGTLRAGQYDISGSVSSQYITGLLFALPLLSGDSCITVQGDFESAGYVDLTQSVMARFGVPISRTGSEYLVHGGQRYTPQAFAVEGDYSQAAFFLVAGAVSGEIAVSGLLADSLQPDRAIVDFLRRMGADIRRSGSTLTAGKSQLHGITADVSQCPDLVPPLAIAAAFAQGQTSITGAARLRIKESDRLAAMAAGLRALGISAAEQPDGLVITGGKPGSGTVNSFGDHRITMAFAVAAAGSAGGVRIEGAQSIAKSYPGFFKDFEALGGDVS